MRNITVVKSNVRKMIDAGANEEELNEYVASQGYTKQQIKDYKIPKLEAGAKNFLSGFTGNFSDELIGAGAAGLLKATGKNNGRSFSDLYKDIRGEERGALNEARSQHPVLSFASELAGGIVPGIGAAGLAAKAGLTGLRGAAASNAGLGAIYGAGNARNLEDVPEEAASGAAISGALGAGLHGIFNPKETASALLRKAAKVNPEKIQAFHEAGINPTYADVGGRTGSILQNLTENVPFAGEIIKKARDQQIQNIQNQLTKITGSEGGTIHEAGTTLKEGAKNFLARNDARVEQLYNKVERMVPKETPVSLKNTFDIINDPVVGTAAEIGIGNTKRITSFINQIKEATEEGKLVPYSSLRTLRTMIGKQFKNPNLEGDERAAISKIYGALSNDMRNAVAQSDMGKIGKESALKAFDRANKYFGASSDFIKKNIEPLVKAETPKKVYDLALKGTRQGGTDVRRIMKNLNPDQQDFVRSSITNEMGLATAGQQNAYGDVFSPAKFLTEWNKLNKVNPNAIKDIYTPSQRTAILNLNKAISNLKESGKLKQTSNNLPYATIGASLLGAFKYPTTTALTIGASLLGAKLMTNPAVLNWFAQSAKVKTANQFAEHLKRLSSIAAANPDIREDIMQLLQSL
jgi:hypothetical protein